MPCLSGNPLSIAPYENPVLLRTLKDMEFGQHIPLEGQEEKESVSSCDRCGRGRKAQRRKFKLLVKELTTQAATATAAAFGKETWPKRVAQ